MMGEVVSIVTILLIVALILALTEAHGCSRTCQIENRVRDDLCKHLTVPREAFNDPCLTRCVCRP